MIFHHVIQNTKFIGRKREWAKLSDLHNTPAASIIVVYGRRRVGKTEFIEQFFRTSNLLKFEGLEVSAPKRGIARVAIRKQIAQCVRRLGRYLEQETIFQSVVCKTWTDFFELLTPILREQPIVLYFEEVQWLACYNREFFAELKPFWDDIWRHNSNLRIVFSGSSPSFVLGQFLGNSALYGRSEHVFSLLPFSFSEACEYLGSMGLAEKLLVYLCVGGIPGYLKRFLEKAPSVLLKICQEAYTKDGYFVSEYSRVFLSTLANNPQYEQIVELLNDSPYLTRTEISLKITKNPIFGGGFSALINDLIMCGFVYEQTSLLKKDGKNQPRLSIDDEYLHFFNKMISPLLQTIKRGDFEDTPLSALNRRKFDAFLGFSFERFCRKNHKIIAKILGFHGVEYSSGFYVSKAAKLQIDLVFIRKDMRVLVCECKYLEKEIPTSIGYNLNEKIDKLIEATHSLKHYTFEKVLIVNQNIKKNAALNNLFDHIITLDNILQAFDKPF